MLGDRETRSAFKSDLRGRDIVSAKDLSRDELELVFEVADDVLANSSAYSAVLRGRRVALLFVEPSTRTFSSFYIAARRLGGDVLPLNEPEMTSLTKGETLYDTLKMLEGYGVDCIVMRHPSRGAARFAADVVSAPVINAGSGSQEHPTQAILDVYTILKKRGEVDGISLGMLGDLRFSRTVPSLAYLVSNFDDVELHFIAPSALQVRQEVELYLNDRNVKYTKVTRQQDIPDAISRLDVLYVTRLQKERFPDPSEYERLKGSYRVDMDMLRYAKTSLGVMHPLPRVDELDAEIDRTPHAWYFDQASYGLPTRMAIFALVVGEAR
ncbi:MAG: aspartate carbamoyltransferase [Thaumarchaeota archaeon]|nr:aspartate carbamoyltransferase [Candidatus Calditenuaceae archaeon]MDW8041722.1 aspartate carbamoyltransferase [Nitrososphaerota archaeon]